MMLKRWAKKLKAKISGDNFESNSDEHLRALTDMMCYAIKNQNVRIARTINEFYYIKFSNFRRAHAENPRSYPDVYYDSVLKIVEELCSTHNSRFNFLSNSTIGGAWLIGEIGDYPISDTTYRWVWKLIVIAIENDRDDMVMDFWRNANQYASFNLSEIYPEYDYTAEGPELINKDKIDEREIERKKLFEFTHAIGGLALFKRNYELLDKMFTFSNSMPAKYALLPDNMDDVFSRYFTFLDPYYKKFRDISRKYYFPKLKGISGEELLKYWMNKYSALLFLRQYILTPNITIDDPVRLPNIPESQSEKRMWQENVDHFKELIKDLQKNNDLLETLSLSHLGETYFRENNQPSIDEFFDNLHEKILEDFEEEEINQELSTAKVAQFYDSTEQILIDTIHEYEAVQNESDIMKNFNRWGVNDISETYSKSAFVENQAVSYLNYDSFFAEAQANKIKSLITETFKFNRTKSFLFKNEDLFKAVDKIVGEGKNVFIVNFGIYLDYLINQVGIEKLSNESYRDIPIINFQHRPRGFGKSLYILQRSDLPSFSYDDPDEELIDKYNLRPINEDFNIYASVIDLNNDDDLREELSMEPEKLRSSVYLYLASRLFVKWKKKAKVFELKQFTEFQEKGIPNKLSDINDSLR